MKYWYEIRFWIGVFWVWIFVRSGGYYLYSRMMRWMLEHKHRKGNPPIRIYRDYPELLDAAYRWQWDSDKWYEGYDVISYPWTTQARINDPDPKIGDCDDWSMYLCHVLPQVESKTGLLGESKCVGFRVLTVCYMDRTTGEYGGHNVCLFAIRRNDSSWFFGHASNWRKAQLITSYKYIKSKMNEPYVSITEIVEDICGPDKINLGWATCDETCRRNPESGRFKHGE